MIKILFICTGNICRSPMAEFILKDMVRRRGIKEEFLIDSAGISMEEYGNPVYPPARKILAEHGIGCSGHHARQIERSDYQKYDYIIAMEQYHARRIAHQTGGDPEGKIYLMLDFAGQSGDIDDPWYTGDFKTVYRQICAGCEGLLAHLEREGQLRPGRS